MVTDLAIGFIGFGEAGFHIARGLRAAGATRIHAYDINTYAPALGERIQARAARSEVCLLASSAGLAEASDILFSAVTADRAMEAAQQTAPFLRPRHIYVDINSVSPGHKQSIGRVVSESGARFVEAAVMSPAPSHGHHVPMLLGGVHSPVLAQLLAPYGMNLEVVSEHIGVASATKMCRSIIVKGLEALMLECVLSAVPYGADERVFATLDETFPGMNWKSLADYMVGRVVEHGERRSRELDEVAATLRAIGVEPVMAEAASRRQAWCAALELLKEFGGKAPGDYRAVVKAIRDKQAATSAETSKSDEMLDDGGSGLGQGAILETR
jgi:3-hydroxyisobutyrate dehydrogenase-like beta-hydroxyacid dehydrogenase